jgi:hypothetical protein
MVRVISPGNRLYEGWSIVGIPLTVAQGTETGRIQPPDDRVIVAREYPEANYCDKPIRYKGQMLGRRDGSGGESEAA